MDRHIWIALGGVIVLAMAAALIWRAPLSRVVDAVSDALDGAPTPAPADPDKPVLRHGLPVYGGKWAFRSSVRKAA